MAQARQSSDDFTRPLSRLLFGLVLIILFAIFLFWRIDSPRAEQLRANLIDRFIPVMELTLKPVNSVVQMVNNYQSYQRIYEQNQELRRELRRMQAWKQAALQLEQQNAKLLDLNNVKVEPKFSVITGVVMADSGSPFRQSVLLNIGARDGIRDGWAAMDGMGLVGRVAGVGERSARVILLTDTSSLIPVTIQPSGQRAILTGDNTNRPVLAFIENADLVRPGDRIETSGDGGLFPADLLVGQVSLTTDDQLRATLAADYERLDFLRVLRGVAREQITGVGELLPSIGIQTFEPAGEDAPEPSEGDDG